MPQEQTEATQAPETTRETLEQRQARELAEGQERVENKFARFMKNGTETPSAEVSSAMQAEATEKTAKVVADSEKLAEEARGAGTEEIAQKAEGLGNEAMTAKGELDTQTDQETQPTETTTTPPETAEATPEAPAQSGQAKDDVFKSIAKQRNEARIEFGDKEQKSTRQILEEMKGQTIADLRRALDIRNDYLVDQIKVYQELIDSEKPNQGLQRKDERIRLRELESEQEKNAAKSRELLSRQSYEIYE